MRVTIEDLEQELTVKRRECDAVRARYRNLLADCGDLEYRIRDLKDLTAIEIDLQDSVPVATQSEASPAEQPGPSSSYLPMDVDLRGAVDHVERFRRLVLHSGRQEWHIDAVCQWIVDTGASSATPESIRSRLYAQLKKASDFTKVRPRVFRFCGEDASSRQ